MRIRGKRYSQEEKKKKEINTKGRRERENGRERRGKRTDVGKRKTILAKEK